MLASQNRNKKTDIRAIIFDKIILKIIDKIDEKSVYFNLGSHSFSFPI